MKRFKFAIKTLGCKVNQYEEQVLRENLLRLGFQESGIHEADVFIINSCTVTGKADAKTRKLIQKAKKESPNVKVFVTGCYAILEEDIKKIQSLPGVDAVVPGGDKNSLPAAVGAIFGNPEEDRCARDEISDFSSHTRAFLKIQDGCDQRCSYCKVNIVRGPSKSRDEQSILKEAVRLIEKGYKEIVLTGICIGSWRGMTGGNLSDLLVKINALSGDFRVRISSIEPNHVDNRLIETIASSGKICDHLHIPLQSGSNKTLKAMNRRYTAGDFKKLFKRIRKHLPDAGLTTDVIAGFPDENETDFDETLQFLRETKPSRMHVFKYSDRKGTPAFDIKDKVPPHISKKRVKRLMEIGDELQIEFCAKFTGKEVDVLVERETDDGCLEGYTGEYLRSKLDGFKGSRGDIIRVKTSEIPADTACLFAKHTEIPANC